MVSPLLNRPLPGFAAKCTLSTPTLRQASWKFYASSLCQLLPMRAIRSLCKTSNGRLPRMSGWQASGSTLHVFVSNAATKCHRNSILISPATIYHYMSRTPHKQMCCIEFLSSSTLSSSSHQVIEEAIPTSKHSSASSNPRACNLIWTARALIQTTRDTGYNTTKHAGV